MRTPCTLPLDSPLPGLIFGICGSENMLTSIDVKFIFDIARLGLFSSANILQIAHVALLAVLAMLLAIISPSSHS